MINSGLVTEYLRKSFHVIPGPALVHFAITAEFRAHQVMFALYAGNGEPVGLQRDKYFSADRYLCVLKEFLDISHRGIQHLAFMQPVAIPGAQLILPIELPLGQGMFFQQVMRLDNDQRGSGFETHPSLDADDGIPDMDIPAYAIGLRNGLQVLDRLDRI